MEFIDETNGDELGPVNVSNIAVGKQLPLNGVWWIVTKVESNKVFLTPY